MATKASAVMHRWFREVWCEGRPDSIRALFPPDGLAHGLGSEPVRGPEAFLAFSKSRGNDLSTPMPEYAFPGLKSGDRWCLVALRWVEALQAGMAPRIILAATHQSVLRYVEIEVLRKYALDVS